MSYQFETLQLHSGHKPDEFSLSRAVPLYQTTSYAFRSAQHAANLFNLEEPGNIYTRIGNPTTDVFEQRMAALEGGKAALAVSSGQAAIFLALTTLARSGDNIVSSPFLYGGSYNLLKISLRNFGIEPRFTASIEAHEFEEKIDANTKALYVESLGNPSFVIPDFEELAKLSKKYGIPLVVDNTLGAGGYLCKPIALGANLVVESATKWIGGHGTSIGGIIIDSGNFLWNNGKFTQFTEPSEGYHDLQFWEKFGDQSASGNIAFIAKARVEGLRDFGPAISPFNSFLLLQGLETLSLRVERQVQNTYELTRWLLQHPSVESVNYAGLETNPYHQRALKYFPKGPGSVFTFTVKGGKENARAVVENLKLVSHVANVGDARTLIIQPSTTTHNQLNEAELEQSGISPSMLRVSVGFEHIEDLKADFDQALQKPVHSKKGSGNFVGI